VKDTLERWLHQPDHFDWLSTYIADHGLQTVTRIVIGGSGAVLGLMAALLTLSPAGPHGVAPVIVSVSAGTLGVAMGSLWLFSWPSRRGSMAFALAANGCFASVCLVQPNSLIGLLGCSAFATIGGYIALFHTPRFLAFQVVVATVTTSVLGLRVIAEHDIVLGVGLASLVGAVDVSVSFVILLLMHFLRIDVLESDRDPLTYLFNRRGFDRAARTLLAAPRQSDAHLIVVMVDLDRFKVLNDDLGHATGDQALIAVADVLRAHANAAAVIGRVGGEEFLVAEITSAPDPVLMADRLCRAIAATAYPITASIGTAATALHTRHDATEDPALAALIDIADAAMYEAKRRGGNRTHHQDCSLPSAGAAG
jgi:diguanylate cyclase (GGDEF)-like protein